MNEITKRLLTSIFLIILLILAFFYSYILIILLVLISTISWLEFNGLISRIFYKKKFKNNFLSFLFKIIVLTYLTTFSFLVFDGIVNFDKVYMFYLFCICIASDTGGFIFGKTFKGKKLTKISPNKTISGSIGSFVLSLSMIPLFYYLKSYDLFYLIFLTIIVSLTCQIGDLFISYLKRKAKIKDTGDILPGHGGLLDRIDGMLLALPVGIFSTLILQI